MRKALTALIVAFTLPWLGGLAYAQTPPQLQAPDRQELPPRRELPPAPKLNLTLEQEHTIKEFIKDIRASAPSADVEASVGDPVPAGVNPTPMPADVGQKVPQVKTHKFFVTAQAIVIVDPKDNKVADVIKLSGD
jgi:Protein of unknown function (DUF1236)